MSDIEFYHNWLFYGGIAGVIGTGITTFIYSMKIGPRNFNWKHASTIVVIFMFPTIILPILLVPGTSLFEKLCVTIGISLFGALRYFVTTKGQEGMKELRKMKEEQKEKSEERKDWF